MPGRPRIYLAGPDVFRPDAEDHFAMLVAVCETLGMEALTPFDESVTQNTAPQSIFAANMALLRSAHGVVANLVPFRGPEPDSGTVFEVGAAVALGVPVVAYGMPEGSYADTVSTFQNVHRASDGTLRDTLGFRVEDFGLPLNLMLANSVSCAATAEDALVALQRRLQEKA